MTEPPVPVAPQALARLVRDAEAAFSGRLAFAFWQFGTGSSYLHRADEAVRAASLIKLPLLVQALSEVAAGRLSLGTRYPLRAADQVAGNGVLRHLEPGLEPSLRDLLTLMIVLSDNTATNLVIDLLGQTAVNDFLQQLGLGQTQLVGKLQLPAAQQTDAQRRGESNRTCAADVLGLLLRLERGELLPPAETELAKGILQRQQYTEALARYLPTDPELHAPHVMVASKSGCLRGLWHDAGLVYAANGRPLYALVVLTEDAADRSYAWEQEGMLCIARLSRAVFDLTRAELDAG